MTCKISLCTHSDERLTFPPPLEADQMTRNKKNSLPSANLSF